MPFKERFKNNFDQKDKWGPNSGRMDSRGGGNYETTPAWKPQFSWGHDLNFCLTGQWHTIFRPVQIYYLPKLFLSLLLTFRALAIDFLEATTRMQVCSMRQEYLRDCPPVNRMLVVLFMNRRGYIFVVAKIHKCILWSTKLHKQKNSDAFYLERKNMTLTTRHLILNIFTWNHCSFEDIVEEIQRNTYL